jgi:small-conductance mechanosensitive channel
MRQAFVVFGIWPVRSEAHAAARRLGGLGGLRGLGGLPGSGWLGRWGGRGGWGGWGGWGGLGGLGGLVVLCVLASALLFGPAAQAQSAPAAAAPAPEPATLRLLNRDIVTFRGTVAGAVPARRVEQALERIRVLPETAMDLPLRVVPFAFEQVQGVQFMLGDINLFAVLQTDVEADGVQTLDALAKRTADRLEDARRAWHATRDGPLLLRGLALAAAATALFVLLVWGTLAAMRRIVGRLEAMRDRLAARGTGVDWRELLARLLAGTLVLVQWLVLVLLGYAWVRAVLASFVATRPLAEAMDGWFFGQLAWVAGGAVGAIPGLATVVIVLLLTRALADVLAYFFNAVQQGRLTLPLLHRDTTTATRRIVTVLVWGLGVAIAYPYLPGSGSEAFKGLSVLAGVMLTLGSSGLVMQAMSGLVIIYSRALRKGDFIDIGGTQGVVTEVGSLAIKMINIRNEEITIPNSVLVSAPIHNYSKLSDSRGTLLTAKVTIGYDAPWRQVHAMLEEAARRTPRVRAEPPPYVYQRALSDFYVEYELFVSIEKAIERVPIQSALHAAIQDVFNEHGVQIMSPHFLGQPAQAVVVPKADWYKAPARPPA